MSCTIVKLFIVLGINKVQFTVICQEVIHSGLVEWGHEWKSTGVTTLLLLLLLLMMMMMMIMIDWRHDIVSCTLWSLDKERSRHHEVVRRVFSHTVMWCAERLLMMATLTLPRRWTLMLCSVSRWQTWSTLVTCTGDKPSWQTPWLTPAATNRHASPISAAEGARASRFHLAAVNRPHARRQSQVTHACHTVTLAAFQSTLRCAVSLQLTLHSVLYFNLLRHKIYMDTIV